jgi:hypothetical protein
LSNVIRSDIRADRLVRAYRSFLPVLFLAFFLPLGGQGLLPPLTVFKGGVVDEAFNQAVGRFRRAVRFMHGRARDGATGLGAGHHVFVIPVFPARPHKSSLLDRTCPAQMFTISICSEAAVYTVKGVDQGRMTAGSFRFKERERCSFR